MRCLEYGSGLFLHAFGELVYFAELHHPCPAIVHTGWLDTFSDASAAQIATIGRKGEIVQLTPG
jgi:hypothetical protein